MTDPVPTRPPARRPIWAALLFPALLVLFACMDDNTAPTVTTVPTATIAQAAPATTTERPIPSLSAAFPTSTITVSPSPTATVPGITPSGIHEPPLTPPDQVEDLPNVRLTYAIDARLREIESGIVDAVSVVTVENLEATPLERLFFRVVPGHFNAFSLNGLTRDGVAVEPFGSDGSTLPSAPAPRLTHGLTRARRPSWATVSRTATTHAPAMVGRSPMSRCSTPASLT